VTRARQRSLAGAAAAVLLAAAAPDAGAAEGVRTVASRPGVTQAFLLVRPAGRPSAAVVLFTGGNGVLGLASGRLGSAGNFLVRNRGRFAEHGLLVALIDTPSDRPAGLDGFRSSAAHADACAR
jgi:hypothetical protein